MAVTSLVLNIPIPSPPKVSFSDLKWLRAGMVLRQLRLASVPHCTPWLSPEQGWHCHLELLQLVTTSSCFLRGTGGEAIPWRGAAGGGAGARRRPGRDQAWPRRRIHRQPRGHRPAQEIPGPRGWGAGKDSHAILTLASLPPGWLRETGYGLGGSGSAHHATWGSESVKSLAPGCPPDPTPKMSPNHPTGRCSQRRHFSAPSGGLLQPPQPPPPSLRFSPIPSHPVIHARSSSGPLWKAPAETLLRDASVRAVQSPAARRAGQHLCRGLHCSAFLRPPHRAASTGQERSVCKAAVPAGGAAPGTALAGRV